MTYGLLCAILGWAMRNTLGGGGAEGQVKKLLSTATFAEILAFPAVPDSLVNRKWPCSNDRNQCKRP